jgi:hypothetical protein
MTKLAEDATAPDAMTRLMNSRLEKSLWTVMQAPLQTVGKVTRHAQLRQGHARR